MTARLLTTAEVAERLHINVQHVRHLIRVGRLSAVDVSVGTRPTYRVTTAQLDSYLRRRVAA